MFGDFLYLLRRSGLKISLTEWMALMEALDKGLETIKIAVAIALGILVGYSLPARLFGWRRNVNPQDGNNPQ